MSDSTPASSAGSETVRVLLTTAPPDVAEAIAQTLVEERLAACVNLIPGVRSVYRWEGALQNDPETLLLIKCTVASLPALRDRLGAIHPYEVPELVALGPKEVSAPYLAWLLDAVADPSNDDTNEG